MTTDTPNAPDDFDDEPVDDFGDDFDPEESSEPADGLFVSQYGTWCGWQDGTPEEEAEDLGTGPMRLRVRPDWNYSFEIYHNDNVEEMEGSFDRRVREFCERVAGFPQLRTLSLGEFSLLSDEAFAGIASLRGLRKLTINGTERISRASVRRLAGLPMLEELALQGLPDADATVCALLASIPTLRRLELNDSPDLTDAGVVALSRSKSLRELSLHGCHRVGDKACAALARMPLEKLSLEHLWKLSNRGLRALESSATLRELWMPQPGNLKYRMLAGLMCLIGSEMDSGLPFGRMTHKGVARLCEALPDCEIDTGIDYEYLRQVNDYNRRREEEEEAAAREGRPIREVE